MHTVKHPKNKENLEFFISGLLRNDFTLGQVSCITGYSTRQLTRLKGRYSREGAQAFVNGHKGRKAANKIPDKIKKQIVDIYKTEFIGFNFNFFKKALSDFRGISHSYKTIYKILTEAGIESPEKHRKRKKKVHRPRYRREQAGDLVQIDATPYQWFSWCGDTAYYTLHGAIDDANEELTGLCMTENECCYGYYDILEQTLENKGVMIDLYSDRSAIFCVNPKDKDKLTVQEQLSGIRRKRTQWQRILADLHIRQILAWSPQAKGRVERLWRTLQGRLPWYFKRYRIKNADAANEFLKKNYIRIFNEEFSLETQKNDAWRTPPKNYRELICSRYERTADNSGVISFQGYKFSVDAPNAAKKKIELCVYKNGMKALVDGVYYPVTLRGEIQDGIGETMSASLKNIIREHMLSDCKRRCA